jgi:tetratricopeptide (TPR) repeat protein
MVKIKQRSYLLLISILLLYILTSISCSTSIIKPNTYAVQQPLSQLKITKIDKDTGYTLNYIFYLDDENVEVQLADKEKNKSNIQSVPSKQIAKTMELREAKLRRKLKADYSRKLKQSIRDVTDNYIKAQTYYYKKQYKKASQFINKAIKYGASSSAVLSLASFIYYATGKLDLSIKYGNKALQIDSSLNKVKKILLAAKKQKKAKKN